MLLAGDIAPQSFLFLSKHPHLVWFHVLRFTCMQKYGGKHAEVFSPDFISVHKPGDRWFCTICFSPLACKCAFSRSHGNLYSSLEEGTAWTAKKLRAGQSNETCAMPRLLKSFPSLSCVTCELRQSIQFQPRIRNARLNFAFPFCLLLPLSFRGAARHRNCKCLHNIRGLVAQALLMGSR